ncbi:hypothetical protein ACEPAI_3454 [Sanghuangporus weigelae]
MPPRTSMYEMYGLRPDFGSDFKHSGVTHFVLFDREPTQDDREKSVETVDSNEIHSPIISSFHSAILSRTGNSKTFVVHVIPSVGRTTELSRSMFTYKMRHPFRTFSTAFQFAKTHPHLLQQVYEGYKVLMHSYNIDEALSTRDRVYLFGDGEGAVVANATAYMIRKTGIFQKGWSFDFDHLFWEAIGLNAYNFTDEVNTLNFRATRCLFMKVDLLGLWCDTRARSTRKRLFKRQEPLDTPPLHLLEGGDSFIGRVDVYPQSTCLINGFMSGPVYYMLKAIHLGSEFCSETSSSDIVQDGSDL